MIGSSRIFQTPASLLRAFRKPRTEPSLMCPRVWPRWCRKQRRTKTKPSTSRKRPRTIDLHGGLSTIARSSKGRGSSSYIMGSSFLCRELCLKQQLMKALRAALTRVSTGSYSERLCFVLVPMRTSQTAPCISPKTVAKLTLSIVAPSCSRRQSLRGRTACVRLNPNATS